MRKLYFIFVLLLISSLPCPANELRRVRGLEGRRPIVLPYEMLFNPYFLEIYWDFLSKGIKVDCGIPDVLFELRKVEVGGKGVFWINFVVKPMRVREIKRFDYIPEISIDRVAKGWKEYLEGRGVLARRFVIVGVDPRESFEPYSILRMNDEELSLLTDLVQRGWSGLSNEGLPEPISFVAELIAKAINIGISNGFLDRGEVIERAGRKEGFISLLKDLAGKLRGEEEEDLKELGMIIEEKFLPWLNSKYGWVIYRVVYTGYIRLLL